MLQLSRALHFPWVVHLALVRLRSQWRSLSAVVGGVLLTAVIGANVPLYTTAVAQVGMVQRLAQQPADQVNIFSRISLSQSDTDDLSSAWNTLDGHVREEVSAVFDPFLKGWAEQTVTGMESEGMFVVRDEADIDGLKMHAAYYEGWADRVRLLSGTLPAEPSDESVDLEAALSATTAAQYDLQVGDVITLDQRGWETSKPVRTLITALVEPIDPADSYWMTPSPLRLEIAGVRADADLLTTRESALRIARDFVPQTGSRFSWRVLFNHPILPFEDIPEAVNRLNTFAESLPEQLTLPPPAKLNPVYETHLAPILLEYQQNVGLLNVFFALLLVQIGGLVLFFLVVIVALVRRSERREVAMLQSRGAFDRQIILMRGVEALIICTVAALVAPFIAQQVLTVFAPVFTHIDQLPLKLDSTPFLYAGITAVLALIVLIGTLRPILRLPLIQGGGSAARSEKSQWWQRYYLDVVLIVVGGAALLRLTSTDTPLAHSPNGSLQGDPLLLLAPAVLFIALGSLLLRLFPAVAELIARIFAQRDGLRGTLAAWQVSREPAHHGRIAFLLVLAIGVGWFATSFQATVEHSQFDQSYYRVGSDVRLSERNTRLKVDRARTEAEYQALDDVANASSAYRVEDFNLSPTVGLQSGTFLAINPDSFTQVAHWRDDLGTLSLPASPDIPLDLPTPGKALSVTPAKLGVWVRLDVGNSTIVEGESQIVYQPGIPFALDNLSLFARLRDADGTILNVPLKASRVEGMEGQDLSALSYNFDTVASQEEYIAETQRVADLIASLPGWVYFEGTPSVEPQGETRFEGFYWRILQDYSLSGPFRRMTLSDLTFTAADGQQTDFGDMTGSEWSNAAGSSSTLSSTKALFEDQHPNGRTAYWHITGTGSSELGILYNYPQVKEIPAVVSRGYAEENTLQVGTFFLLSIRRVSLPLRVVAVVDYFPTLYGDQQPYVVTSLPAFLYTMNRLPGIEVYANEAWIRLKPGVDAGQFVSDQQTFLSNNGHVLKQALTVEDTLKSLQVDPLSLGLIGLLFVAFGVALLLSIVCLLTYTALNAQSRRAEFAVLRALGMSSRRVVMSVALEQVLVMVVAVVLGALLGILLSRQVLPTLAIGTSGGRITPPFIIQVEFTALAQYGLVLLVVLTGVIMSSLLLVSRMSVAGALRYGEE